MRLIGALPRSLVRRREQQGRRQLPGLSPQLRGRGGIRDLPRSGLHRHHLVSCITSQPQGHPDFCSSRGAGIAQSHKACKRMAEPHREDMEGVTVASGSRDAPGKPVQAPLGLAPAPLPAQLQVKQSQTQEHASSQHPFIKNNYKKVTDYNIYVQPKNLSPPTNLFYSVTAPRGVGVQGLPIITLRGGSDSTRL